MRNYTSSVPAVRSIELIERRLISNGATNIMKQIVDGKVQSIAFQIMLEDKRILAFQLPARVDNVYECLSQKNFKVKFDQAERTAWKILYEWCEIQFALIEINQVEFLQVFMPYITNGKKTMYEAFKDSGFKQITGS